MDQIGLKNLGQLLCVVLVLGIAATVAFGHDYCRTVVSGVRNDNTLVKTAGATVFVVYRMVEVHEILFLKLAAFQRSDVVDAFDLFQFLGQRVGINAQRQYQQ